MKICSRCKIERDDIMFSKNKSHCKVCDSEYMKKYYEKNRERRKEERRKYYEKNRDLELNKAREKRKNNRVEYKELDKEQYEKRKDYYIEYNKKYRENNKEYFKQKRITWKKSKENDPLYKFQNSIRISILKAISRNYKKESKTSEIIGCSFEELVIYFESKFENWMSWENRGLYNGEFNHGWDIDHIIPISTSNCKEDIIRLNHYTNLQPLCSKINRDIKKNKVNW